MSTKMGGSEINFIKFRATELAVSFAWGRKPRDKTTYIK